MHTIQVGMWNIHHNSDWSGDAIFDAPDRGGEFKIPGFVLVGLAESIHGGILAATRELAKRMEAAEDDLKEVRGLVEELRPQKH